jgi:hypothetical protein
VSVNTAEASRTPTEPVDMSRMPRERPNRPRWPGAPDGVVPA